MIWAGFDFGRIRNVREELVWIVVAKAVEFSATFALLKILTTKLGPSRYGEVGLAESGLVLVQALVLVPLHESFLRSYHGARENGTLRAELRVLFTGYAIATLSVAVIAALSSAALGSHFHLESATVAAAGLFFLFDKWRFLGVDYRNIRRERRASALHSTSYAVGLVLVAWPVASKWPSASAILFAYAGLAAVFMLASVREPIAAFRAQPPAKESATVRLIGSLGVSLALVVILQWVQNFADRYLIKAMLDPHQVGVYVVAYQVSGVPYTLLMRICHELAVPVAYQRGGDGSDPARIWAADRVILASFGLQVVVGVVMLGVFAVVGPQLIELLASKEYALPGSAIVALALGRWLQSLGYAIQPAFAVHQRAGSLLGLRLVGSAMTFVFCALGIQRAGIQGAAVGGALALAAYLLLVFFSPGGVFRLMRSARRRARQLSPR